MFAGYEIVESSGITRVMEARNFHSIQRRTCFPHCHFQSG